MNTSHLFALPTREIVDRRSDCGTYRVERGLRLARNMWLVVILWTALTATTAFTADSGHDRYIDEQFDRFDKDLTELAKAEDREKGLVELQRRFNELRKEVVDLTKGESNVCPVHHIKMPAKEAPVAYGLLDWSSRNPSAETRERKFPFAQGVVLAGCRIYEDSPKVGRLFLCPKCVEAEKAWIKARK
jgi:hypothetical protein